MKVLLISASYAPVRGGLQTIAQTLARSLKLRGHDVEVLTNRYPRTLAARETLENIPVRRWHFLAPEFRYLKNLRFDLFLAGLFYFPTTLARMILLLRRGRPDVVNLHFAGAPSLFVLFARWLLRFRLVVSLHGDDVEGLPGRSSFERSILRGLLRKADVVTACSEYLLNEAIKFEPELRAKGRTVHNGIEPLSLAGHAGQKSCVIAAGRMFPKKGFDVLLRAQANTKNRRQVTLIGDGPERESLEHLAGSLGLNEIRFSGQKDREGVLAEMAGADLVVIPSRSEPFGMVALEAMALGKPVVASRVGGLPEILKGADALLVEPDEPNTLAIAIDTVLEKVKDNTGFGTRNREWATRFSARRMVDGYVRAYSE
jgi:glycosyltransferase involved in cell wall biosynthesis